MTALFSLIAGCAVMAVSLSGIIFTSNKIGAWLKPRLTYLATFSAGVLAVLAYHLIEEALHEASSFAVVAASIVVGVVALEIIHGLVPDSHHHHGTTDHTHSAVDGRRVLISDGVHNITDGFLIVSSFLADWRIGIGATVGIMLHETVQEISEFFVLKHAGYTNREALTYNFMSSATILIGIGISLVFASSESLLSILAALAAGGFLSVVIRDLIPSAIESAQSDGRWVHHIVAIFIGAALMLSITILMPHEEHTVEAHTFSLPTAQFALTK
jgi:zinc and cadmium transporter